MEIEHQHPMGGISSHQLSTDKFLRAATEQLQSSVSPVSGCSEPLRDPAITFSWDAVLLTTDLRDCTMEKLRCVMHTDGGLCEDTEDPIKHNKAQCGVYKNSSCCAQVKVSAGVQYLVSDVGVCSAVRHAAGMQSIRLAGVWPAQAARAAAN